MARTTEESGQAGQEAVRAAEVAAARDGRRIRRRLPRQGQDVPPGARRLLPDFAAAQRRQRPAVLRHDRLRRRAGHGRSRHDHDQQVMDNIVKVTDGEIDLLIATHEHWDHLSGFVQAAEFVRQAEGPGRSGSPGPRTTTMN